MAIKFTNAVVANIPTGWTQVYQLSNSNAGNWCVCFSTIVANKTGYIKYVGIRIKNSGGTVKSVIAENINVPGGSSMIVPGKITLLPGESIEVMADSTNSLDVTIAILENLV